MLIEIRNSIFRILIMTIISSLLIYGMHYLMSHYYNPRNAYIDGCVITGNIDEDFAFCEYIMASLSIADSNTSNSLFREGKYPITIKLVPDLGEAIGVAYVGFTSCDIKISAQLFLVSQDPKVINAVIYHEVGHCYGLDHSDDKKSLMYPSMSDTVKVDQIKDLLRQIKNQAQ